MAREYTREELQARSDSVESLARMWGWDGFGLPHGYLASQIRLAQEGWRVECNAHRATKRSYALALGQIAKFRGTPDVLCRHCNEAIAQCEGGLCEECDREDLAWHEANPGGMLVHCS